MAWNDTKVANDDILSLDWNEMVTDQNNKEVSLTFSTGLTRTTNTITTNDSEINHNNLSNYDIAEHRTINDAGTGVNDLWSASKINTELGDKAETANAKGFVNHGETAGTARPTGYASIEWTGSVEPTNMENGDTWIDTSE